MSTRLGTLIGVRLQVSFKTSATLGCSPAHAPTTSKSDGGAESSSANHLNEVIVPLLAPASTCSARREAWPTRPAWRLELTSTSDGGRPEDTVTPNVSVLLEPSAARMASTVHVYSPGRGAILAGMERDVPLPERKAGSVSGSAEGSRERIGKPSAPTHSHLYLVCAVSPRQLAFCADEAGVASANVNGSSIAIVFAFAPIGESSSAASVTVSWTEMVELKIPRADECREAWSLTV
mmetsp:Transcript_40682/g.95774  ORF Transcript_40682/g.95774 Transcript_40682/m.95774 type:complete len:236 (+) Transcript_40682:2754-3461(+)